MSTCNVSQQTCDRDKKPIFRLGLGLGSTWGQLHVHVLYTCSFLGASMPDGIRRTKKLLKLRQTPSLNGRHCLWDSHVWQIEQTTQTRLTFNAIFQRHHQHSKSANYKKNSYFCTSGRWWCRIIYHLLHSHSIVHTNHDTNEKLFRVTFTLFWFCRS